MPDPRRLPLAVTLLIAAGCSSAPRYERPAAPIPATWPAGAEPDDGAPADQLGWRAVFTDARLAALIELALRHNRDLRVAALDVERVRARYDIVRADRWPRATARAGAEIGTQRSALAGAGGEVGGVYQVGVGAAFELDLFGRLDSLANAALAEYLSTREARRSVHLTLVAEVATRYLAHRALDARHALAAQSLDTSRASYALTRDLVDAGQRSELDLRSAETQVQAVLAELARLDRLRAQAEHAIELLVGVELPPDLPAPPDFGEALVADVPAGLRSELLRRRPDILAAEHALEATYARIGAARAARFPSISLTGFAGLVSTALTSLFAPDALAWALAPQIDVPLFTAGRDAAVVEVAEIERDIALARYERALRVAFREVADALVARAALGAQFEAQAARVTTEETRLSLSDSRYRAGVESYLVVLAAQRDLFAARQELVDVRLTRLVNRVDLYRALGGGWQAGATP